MCRLSIPSVVLILILGTIHSSNAFKWIPLKSGDEIPADAVQLHNDQPDVYVGRARHYNLILPAEVTQQGAMIYNLDQIIKKSEYEVLVAKENCQWPEYTDQFKNAVRAGTAWNGEPIYVGRSGYSRKHIASIFLTSRKDEPWPGTGGTKPILLICNQTNDWVDSSYGELPKNAVTDDSGKIIARLLGPASFIAAEVLVGDPDEYSWVRVQPFEIPEYAVVVGQTVTRELLYVAYLWGQVRNMAFSDASEYEMKFLVKNKH